MLRSHTFGFSAFDRAVRCVLNFLAAAIAPTVALVPAVALAQAPPTLPTIGAASYSIAASNPNVDGGATAVNGSSSLNAATNTAVINDYIAYASAHGGGTIEVPAGTYISNELLLANNVDLNVDGTLQNNVGTATFITSAAGGTDNMGITGTGTINNNATKTSNNKMIMLDGITNLAVEGVTIENAPNEHLVTECCSNVTISGITIQDSKIQANTDGIDYSGTNYLITGCNISDGDDDIVAKPNTDVFNGITAHSGNIVITNDTITAGHGISIGGQTNAGLDGMYVANCTIAGSASNPLENGIHLKAGDGAAGSGSANGGLVENVTFNHITMSGVDDAIAVDSFYEGGSDYPDKPSATDPFPVAPTDSTEPLWENITFENITITGATGSAGQFYGLNSSPANSDGFNFINMNITASNAWDMYYLDDVYMNGVVVNGTTLPDSLADLKDAGDSHTASDEYADTFDMGPNAIYNPVPEPSSLSLLAATLLPLVRRRRSTSR
jgi:polygalacturonase